MTIFLASFTSFLVLFYVGWNSKRWYMNWRYKRVWICEKDFYRSDKYEEKYVMPGNFVWKYPAFKETPIFLYEDGTTSQQRITWRENLADFRENK